MVVVAPVGGGKGRRRGRGGGGKAPTHTLELEHQGAQFSGIADLGHTCVDHFVEDLVHEGEVAANRQLGQLPGEVSHGPRETVEEFEDGAGGGLPVEVATK